MTREEHLEAGNLTESEALTVIDALVALARPVDIHFRWRPQLRDSDDEMVLEAAISAEDRTIVTFNIRDFVGAADQFNVALATPAHFLESLK